MQPTDTVYTYAPIGDERPEPYPDGFVPDASRWSGREYARIATRPDGGPSIFGDDAPAGDPRPGRHARDDGAHRHDGPLHPRRPAAGPASSSSCAT